MLLIFCKKYPAMHIVSRKSAKHTANAGNPYHFDSH